MRPEAASQFSQPISSDPKRIPQWYAWAVGFALMAIFFIGDIGTLHQGHIGNNNYWGRDFINVWTGGLLVRQGRSQVLNDFNLYVTFQRTLFGNIDNHNYSYPPVSYPLAAVFAFLPYWAALLAWIGSTGALFIYACRRWWPTALGPVWLAALTPAALMNVWDGQYGYLIGALFLLGWQWVRPYPRLSGVAFGLMILKPHLAVLIPIALLVRREWSTLASAVVTVVALIGATIFFFGWNAWIEYFIHTGPMQASMINARGTFFSFMSTSTATALVNVGVSATAAMVAQGLVAALALIAVCFAAHKGTPTKQLAFLVATCTFLVLPYAFNYDLTVVAVGAITLMATDRTTEFEHRAAVYAFICAPVGMLLAALGVPAAPGLLAALAVAQFHRWVVCRSEDSSEETFRGGSFGRAPEAACGRLHDTAELAISKSLAPIHPRRNQQQTAGRA